MQQAKPRGKANKCYFVIVHLTKVAKIYVGTYIDQRITNTLADLKSYWSTLIHFGYYSELNDDFGRAGV